MSPYGLLLAEYRTKIEGHAARAPSGVGKRTRYRIVTLVFMYANTGRTVSQNVGRWPLIAQDLVRTQDGLCVKAEYLALGQISVQALLFVWLQLYNFLLYILEIYGLMMAIL